MSAIAAAVVGSAVVGGYLSSQAQEDAANTAAGAQTSASQAGIAEQQRQYDQIRQLLSPYVSAGTRAQAGQLDLLGMNGDVMQGNAIKGIQNSSLFNTLKTQGENSILANASATGGLRGGNVQGALGQFSPNLLNSLIESQYSKLGGISSLGENAAALVGNAGMNTGNQISGLFQQQGAAQAGAALAGGRADATFYNGLGNGVGAYYGLQRLAPQDNSSITESLF